MKTRPIPSKNAHLKNVIFKLESYSKLNDGNYISLIDQMKLSITLNSNLF